MNTAAEFTTRLLTALDTLAEVHPDDLPCDLADFAEDFGGARVTTFGQAALMTTDEGLVVRMSDGTEFQMTIVRSR